MKKDAQFCDKRIYRYALARTWDEDLPVLAIIGLNPSTADEELDDPTIRRCISFAKRDGYGAICMLNLFAFRATDPKTMKAAEDPVGPMNDEFLSLNTAGRDVLLAWGANAFGGRAYNVMCELRGICRRAFVLGLTKAGYPRHPLYLKSTTPMAEIDLPSRENRIE